MNRRRFLCASGATLAASAGCVGLGSVFGGDDLPTIDGSGDDTGTISIDPGNDAEAGDSAAIWPQRAAGAGNTSAALGAAGPGDDPEVAWESLAGRETGFRPAADDRRLYVMSGRGVDARSLADGDQLWNRSIPWLGGQLAVHDGVVILPARNSQQRDQLVGLDADTGEQQWSHTDGVQFSGGGVSSQSSVTVAEGQLFLASERGVLSLSTANGTLHWSRPLGPDGKPDAPSGTNWTLPAVAGERVITFDVSGDQERQPTVYALDRFTGDGDWTTSLSLSEEWWLSGYPVAGGGEVFVRAKIPDTAPYPDDSEEVDGRGENYRIYALDVATGEPAWRWDLPGVPIGSPAYAAGALFCWTTAEPRRYRLHAVDVADRSVAWTYTTEADNLGRPVGTSDSIYFVHDTDIVALSVADGSPDWSVSVGEGLYSTGLVVADDTIYAMAEPVDPERGTSDDAERVVAVR